MIINEGERDDGTGNDCGWGSCRAMFTGVLPKGWTSLRCDAAPAGPNWERKLLRSCPLCLDHTRELDALMKPLPREVANEA